MSRIVITSIQRTTPSVDAMVVKAAEHGWRLVVVGDRKTPAHEWGPYVDFVSIDAQRQLDYRLVQGLPENHYARKNLGYLEAMRAGAPCIYDTDDDNAPLGIWKPRGQETRARACRQAGWVNAYSWFSELHIWPRGLPLQSARQAAAPTTTELAPLKAPIQQGLANGSPDVDAVWRLLMDREVRFDEGDSVSLAQGSWCPFNSQSTWWFPDAYPLLYLPSHVSFRMTDIWRSFVAQRCLWAMDRTLVFHGPEVFQDRNQHNLLRDFEQEVPGYLGNDKFREVLESLSLATGPEQTGQNIHRCYAALVASGLVPEREMPLVDAWLADIESVRTP